MSLWNTADGDWDENIGAGGGYLTIAAASGTYAPLATPTPFKRIVLRGGGNKSRTGVGSTAFAAIDSTNLGYQTLTLAVGDVVECTLACTVAYSVTTAFMAFDFEVDQPTSGDTRVNAGEDFGAGAYGHTANAQITVTTYFTATEAGVHGFRPMWRNYSTAHTATMWNASSGDIDVPITVCVKKLGTPTA
jgi:hypothetical protein